MEHPLVTIITVTYNSSKYVRKAIESILASSYINFQLIIGDDCSTDDTWSIIQEYRDSRILCYKNEKNIGEYPNRNKAIGLARGEFIFFIDGDDMLFFRGIEDAIREMLRYPECQFGVVNTQSLKCVGPIKIFREDAFNLEFFGGGVIDGSLTNNVFRTSFLKENLFFTEYKFSDTYSRIKFLEKTDVLVLYSIIGAWRISPNQASQKVDQKKSINEMLHFYKHHLLNDKSPIKIDVREKIKARYYKSLFRHLAKNFYNIGYAKRLLKSYLIDDLFGAFVISRAKIDSNFWDHYNWDNINMDIVNNNGSNSVTIK